MIRPRKSLGNLLLQMEEALYDMEAFILRQGLARAADVRRGNMAAAAAAPPGSAEETAPGATAAATEIAKRAVRRAWTVMQFHTRRE